MSGKPDNPDPSYSEQLSELESRLHDDAGDEAMLVDMHVAIRTLLSSHDESGEQIKELLQKRFSEGHLRAESYELVKNMLESIIAEDSASLFATDEMMALAPKEQPDKRGDSLFDTAAMEASVSSEDTAELIVPAHQDMSAATEDSFVDTAVLETTALHEDSADERLQVGSVLRDRFLLQERISGGSMGVVYKALDRRLAEVDERNPYVAIKVLSSQLSRNGNALQALQQEAAKGRFLSHRNIVRFIDLDRDDDLYFIVMEWLEGDTLADILDDKLAEKLPLAKALDIVRQVARALDYAHRRGVVHADVKPGNIIFTPTGLVKLFDFGVARVRQKEHEGKSKFDPGVMEANTPAYSSMQVLTGEVPVPADDVFSLACLMYRLVANHRVFGPRNAADAAAEGMEAQRPQGLGEEHWRALKKALSYSRVTRFESPADFVKALDASATIEALQDDPVDSDEDREPRRFPWRVALPAVIVLAAMVVLVQPDLTDIDDKPSETDMELVTPEPQVAAVENDLQPAAGTVVEFPPRPVDAPPADVDTAMQVEEAVVAEPVTDAEFEEPVVAEEAPPIAEPQPVPSVPVIDFSALPPATLTISIASSNDSASLALREGSAPAIVDLVRRNGSAGEQTVIIREAAFNGSRSPYDEGVYTLENGGAVTFAAGQDRARTQISMRSDQSRAADQQAILQIRDANVVVGVIELTLEDDDQRAFDARVPANTIAFTETQIFASESDSAVQIDAIRYKPDDTIVEVAYLVRDMTATEGADYFAPKLTVIRFGPGQGTARVLIPLTQDAERETDEVFMLELLTDTPLSDPDIFQRIAVMIRDDDS